MTSLKFCGTKRKCSEAPSQTSSASSTASGSSKSSSGQSSASSGGGSASGEVEEEEESSSSSSSASFGSNSSRDKRFKHTLAIIREHASEESNTDLSDDSSKDPTKVKEYGRVNDHQIREAARIATDKGGECVSRVTIGAGETLAFKCRFGHIFRCSIEAAEKDWCTTCIKYYSQCTEFATQNRGRLLDSALCTPVKFQCSQGHVFTCKTYKAKHLRWCAICKQHEEEQKKLLNEEQKAKEDAKKLQEQEKLFDEARKTMEQEAAERAKQEAMCYELYLEQAIRQKAKMETVNGIGEGDCYWVNKILMTPTELLVGKLYAICC